MVDEPPYRLIVPLPSTSNHKNASIASWNAIRSLLPYGSIHSQPQAHVTSLAEAPATNFAKEDRRSCICIATGRTAFPTALSNALHQSTERRKHLQWTHMGA